MSSKQKKLLATQLKNELGISLVMVMIALAMVGAGTTYIMSLNKKTMVQSAMMRNTSFAEQERKRISSFLEYFPNCRQNFGNNTINWTTLGWANPTAPVLPTETDLFATYAKDSLVTDPKVGNITFATIKTTAGGQTYNGKSFPANQYYGGILTLTKMYISVLASTTNPIPPLPRDKATVPTTVANAQLHLVYTYAGDAGDTTHSNASAGKRFTSIKIPLHLNIDTSTNLITDCYAISDADTVYLAISNACNATPPSGTQFPTVYSSSITGGIVNYCYNDLGLDNTTAVKNDPTPASMNTQCGYGTALNGYNIIPQTAPSSGYQMQITATSPGTTNSNCSSVVPTGSLSCTPQIAYGMTAGALNCDYAGAAHDPTECSAGQVIFKTGLTTHTCVSINCSNPNEFINSFTNTLPGFTCAKANTSTCPAGQYAKSFDAAGNPTCDNLPAMNGDCTPGFGYSVTRNSGTYNGTLNCAGYTKTKTCASPSVTTFVNSFNTSTTASCTTF